MTPLHTLALVLVGCCVTGRKWRPWIGWALLVVGVAAVEVLA